MISPSAGIPSPRGSGDSLESFRTPTGLSGASTHVAKVGSLSTVDSSLELAVKCRTESSSISAFSSPSSIFTKELQTEVEPEILRGVSLDVALQGLGRHLQPPDSGMFHVDPKNYMLSRRTTKFHAFLSHDWESSRWMKVIALLIAFNAQAASITTTVVSVLTGILCASGVLPTDFWTAILPHAAFWIVLFFWQRIRSMIGFPVMVFLDKLCIAQHDEALKEQGVLGLAAFLHRSDQLTVLWSKRYFRRLWCSYELATFMKDADKHASIQFIPLKMGVLLSLLALVGLTATTLFYVSLDLGHGHIEYPLTTGTLAAGAVFFFCPLLNYIGIKLMQELRELPHQVCNFRVQKAECFCCSRNHLHPDTGADIPCDRATVALMLQQWFGRPGDLGEEYCRRFNRLVRHRLGPKILRSVGGDALPLSYALYVVCCSNMPWLSTVITQVAAGPPTASGVGSMVWVLRHFLEWAQLCLAMLCMMRVSTLLWKVGSRTQRKGRRILASFAIVVPTIAVGAITWWSFVLIYEATSQDSLLPGIPFLLVLILTGYLYWPSSPRVSDLEEKGMEVEPDMICSPGVSTSADGFRFRSHHAQPGEQQ
ncbi:unnamed protein product, partial [Symbiodinium pilosum]